MTKTYNQVKRKLRKLSKKEQSKSDELVVKQGDNFIVYNMYKITKDRNEFKIYFIDGNEFVTTVFSSATALSWCNAHRGNNIELASNIINTDRTIEFLANDIAYTKILIKLKSTPHEQQSTLLARLTEYVSKQMRLKVNLHKYIQRSKQIKSEGFSNEFTTTSNTKEFKRVR